MIKCMILFSQIINDMKRCLLFRNLAIMDSNVGKLLN